jgi:hypothetical protein
MFTCLQAVRVALFVPAQALQRLGILAQTSSENEELSTFLRDTLLRKIHDDDGSVVLAALDVPLLLTIPPAPLLDALGDCLERATAMVSWRRISSWLFVLA